MSKRRIALLKSLGRSSEAITALNNLLDASPIDAEAWAEIADLYVSQGMYQQGVFALEEVLLITPNAWNVSDMALHPMLLCQNADDVSLRSMQDLGRYSTLLQPHLEMVMYLKLTLGYSLSNHYEDFVGV